MRGTVAKRLREQAKQSAINLGFAGLVRDVQQINHHPKLYPMLVRERINSNGRKEIIDNGVRLVHQNVHNPRTEHGLYRLLKKQYKGKIA